MLIRLEDAVNEGVYEAVYTELEYKADRLEKNLHQSCETQLGMIITLYDNYIALYPIKKMYLS